MDELLERVFALTERLGLPLAIWAWLTVFGGALGMAFIVRGTVLTRTPLIIGTLALTAHLLDYFVTLRITPDLAMEANPIWRIVIDRLGLDIARLYGLTGKILLSILSAQLFAWYLSHRASLFPSEANGLFDFIRKLGHRAPRLGNVRSFFAYAFALFGPYFFYITFMNITGERNPSLYVKLPSPPVAIVIYFLGVTASYFLITWHAFRSR